MLNRPELAQKFNEFKLSKEIISAYKAGMTLIGSLGFTKMMMFANEVKITNDDIDYFVSCPPRRMEDESYEDMKLRTQFTNKLYKYRQHLYDYSVYENE
jgi:DNA-binding cell septation regulator SpoVG